MRLLFTSYFYEYNFGGAEIIARTLKDLAETELGAQVDVACFSGGPSPQPGTILRFNRFPRLSDQPFKRAILFFNNRWFDSSILRALRTLAGETPYDLIHCHDFNALNVSDGLARLLRKPLILSLYDNLPRSLSPGQLPPLATRMVNALVAGRAVACREALSRAAAVVCISDHVQRSARTFFQQYLGGLAKPALSTIYPPAEKYFSLRGGAGLPEPPARPGTILFLGRLSKEKGIDLVLAALPLVPRPADLAILGLDGPLSGIVKAAAARDSRIKILPPVPHAEVKGIMEKYDVICCPSIYEEPFGKTVFEARSLGKKIVTTARGGIAEIIQGYPKAFVVEVTPGQEAGMIRSMAEKLGEALAADPGGISEGSERTFFDRFSYGEISRRYRELYAFLLGPVIHPKPTQ